MISHTKKSTLRTVTFFSVFIGMAMTTGACNKNILGSSKLRGASFPAPFSAALSASTLGWAVSLMSDGGGASNNFSVTEVSYASSTTQAPGIPDGIQTAGGIGFTANMVYTFQFNVKKAGATDTALCETSYAAPLNYSVEKTFITCDTDFTPPLNPGPANTENESEVKADEAMGLAIVQYKVGIEEAMIGLTQDQGYRFSPQAITRWNSLETSVKAIVSRYGDNGVGGTEEVTNTVLSNVQVTDAVRVSSALIAAYGSATSNNTVDPSKVCTCLVAVCTAEECSVPSQQAISSITDSAQCSAKSGTTETSNSDPSSLFDAQVTTSQYSECSIR